MPCSGKNKEIEKEQSTSQQLETFATDIEYLQTVAYNKNDSNDLSSDDMKMKSLDTPEFDNALCFSSHSHVNLKDIKWGKRDIAPTAFIVGKKTSKKVIFGKHEYNHHETNKNNSIYRCK
jgi:hypothetical protein